MITEYYRIYNFSDLSILSRNSSDEKHNVFIRSKRGIVPNIWIGYKGLKLSSAVTKEIICGVDII
jgi:hypothetical protein